MLNHKLTPSAASGGFVAPAKKKVGEQEINRAATQPVRNLEQKAPVSAQSYISQRPKWESPFPTKILNTLTHEGGGGNSAASTVTPPTTGGFKPDLPVQTQTMSPTANTPTSSQTKASPPDWGRPYKPDPVEVAPEPKAWENYTAGPLAERPENQFSSYNRQQAADYQTENVDTQAAQLFTENAEAVQGGGLMAQSLQSDAVQNAPATQIDFSKNAGAAPEAMPLPDRYEAQDGTVQDNQLVEKRLLGLMDSSNPLMKKVIQDSINRSAGRGLQSTSIAQENATNSMFNYALPIAQQDANTMTQQSVLNQQKSQEIGAQDNAMLNQLTLNRDNQRFQSQLETQKAQNAYDANSALQEDQQSFTSGENAAQRNFTSALEQQRAQNQLDLQQDQQTFTADQASKDRVFQSFLENQRSSNSLNNSMALQNDAQNFNKELEALRYQNQQGLLDIQGKQALEQLEQQHQNNLQAMAKQNNLAKERDALLQQFQRSNLEYDAAQALLRIEQTAKENMALQDNRNSFEQKMEYSNAVSGAINRGIESLGNAMMNTEMSPADFSNYQRQVNNMIQSNIDAMSDIYGMNDDDSTAGGNSTDGGASGRPDVVTPGMPDIGDLDLPNRSFR